MSAPSSGTSHHGPGFSTYMVIALALAVCTIASFFFNGLAQAGTITTATSFALILGVAIIKATLVSLVFMHVQWDWKLLYFLLIPAFVLGAMMMIVLLPDTFLGAGRDAAEALQIASEMP